MKDVLGLLRAMQELPLGEHGLGIHVLPLEQAGLALKDVATPFDPKDRYYVHINPRPRGEVVVAYRDGVKSLCFDLTAPAPRFVLAWHIL